MAKQQDDMAEDWAALSEAMNRDREKNPQLGSPAWARQQQARREQAEQQQATTDQPAED